MRATAGFGLALAALVVALVTLAAPAHSAAATAPAVSTGATTAVTATSANVSGTVNPNGGPTTYAFQYGATTAYGSQTTMIPAGSGTNAVAAAATISGLTSDTTYHYRIVATNSAGAIDGGDATFTTAKAPPVVVTGGAASVTTTSAVLSATVNPEAKSTNYQFQYGTTAAYGQQSAAAAVGSGTAPVAVRTTITGLRPGVTYHYRVIATNPDGTSTGADAIVATVGSSPVVSTGAVATVTTGSAVLGGQVNPNGRTTSYAFEYGTTTAYGSQTTFAAAGSSTTSTKVAATISGLAAGTPYHYRLVATNSVGATVGADATFETSAGVLPAGSTLPVVSSALAVTLTATGAQLNGAINPAAARTTWWFEYGTTGAYGLRTSTQTMTGIGARPINFKLFGLAPGTSFHFRLIAQTSTTLYIGPDAVFTTRAATRVAPAGITLRATARAHARGTQVGVSGALALPQSLPASAACNGVVEIAVMRGGDTISLRSAPLRPDCSFSEQVTFAKRRLAGARRLAVAVHFTGNAVLLPTPARRTSVRA
jgi:phosphodiesterase/alkaline phosphatase D-like protein